ncbi:MAG: toxin-antitoxin system YwqK family antitoxin [Brumimicrobium sp.]|nr:toxin-antitoxin system YwqK family antitoxin [Brumimicrobium sp.]
MKNVLFFLVVFPCFLTGQITNMRNVPCFQKSLDRYGKRYVDWECDPSDPVVDCNENLESDPGSNLVLTRSSGRPFTGDCETCHHNGLRERIVHFNNGRVDGTDTTYYQSGCPQVVRTHIDGVENGLWTYYNDSSGLEAWQINYFNGEKHGKSIFWSHFMVGTAETEIDLGNRKQKLIYGLYDRDTLRIEFYNAGKLHGTKTEYYPGSKVKKEVNYENGVMHGAFITYDTAGNVLQELNYAKGEKDGEWKYYYDDGSLLKTENWSDGVKDGTFKNFYIQGHVQSIENYKNGLKHGRFEERYPDDKIKREAIYKKDELVEEHVFDKYGNEIRTVDEDGPVEKTEDDEIPTTKKKKWWQFWKKK